MPWLTLSGETALTRKKKGNCGGLLRKNDCHVVDDLLTLDQESILRPKYDERPKLKHI